MIFDPIADMLTRIRNAISAKKQVVYIPASKMKRAIAELLKDEGYIESIKEVEKDNKKELKLNLKYGPNGEKVINGLKRISKPGLRVYSNSDEIPKVLNGLGVAIVSTSKGVVTGSKARELNVGGEVIAFVW